jgi:hypothetical protein
MHTEIRPNVMCRFFGSIHSSGHNAMYITTLVPEFQRNVLHSSSLFYPENGALGSCEALVLVCESTGHQ